MTDENADSLQLHDWPADSVKRVAVGGLVPYARNARTHSDTQIAQIAASIREWGFTVPVLIDEAGMIIAGHGRLLAAERLGLETVPAMVATGWSEASKRAYVIADNKLALNAEWDSALLRVELDELEEAGIDLSLSGFSLDEVEELRFDPGSFGAGGEDEQGKLDRKIEVTVTCPECGHEFKTTK